MSSGGPELVVRVSANLSELKTALAEGVTQFETTRSALNTMSNAFDGSRTIAQAGAVVGALLQIGDVTKLTAGEQAKANAILEAGLEKYKALGRDAPPGMRELADATKQVETHSATLTDTVKQLAIGFAGLFTLRAAFDFVKATVNEASALKDLSQQTHINVEALQQMAGAMSEFGVDADTLGKGLYKLSRGIAGGDESVAHGLHLMGLSLTDVQGLNGEELFLKMMRGLSTLQGGLRDTAAADVFGGRLGAAMAGASEGIEGALETWRRLNAVASTESVDAMDAFGESITRANKNVSALATNMLGPLAQGFNVLHDAIDKGASKWDVFVAALKDMGATVIAGQTHTGFLTTLLDHQGQALTKDIVLTKEHTKAHEGAAVALDAHGQAAKFMAAMELDSAKPVLDWQRQYLGHLKEIGELTPKNAAGIGVTADQLKRYTTELAESAKAAKAAAEETKRWDDLLEHLHKTTFTLAMEHQKQWREEQAKQTQRSNAAILAEFDAQTKLNAEWGLNAAGAITLQKTALDRLQDALDALHRSKAEGISQEKEEQVLTDAYTKDLLNEALAQDRVTAALDKTTQATSASTDKFHGFKNEVFLVAQDLATLNKELSKFYDALDVQNGIGDMSGPNGIGMMSGALAGLPRIKGAGLAPPRAEGGPVTAGQPYVVGERRPELFVPETSGTIRPSVGGGSPTINLTMYVNGTGADVARIAMAEITKTLKQSRQLPSV